MNQLLPAVDPHEDLIDKEGVAIASVLSFQSSSVYSSEFDAPKPDGFVADSDASLSQQIFYIAMTKIKSIVEPDSVTDDVGWESVTLVCIHWPTLTAWAG